MPLLPRPGMPPGLPPAGAMMGGGAAGPPLPGDASSPSAAGGLAALLAGGGGQPGPQFPSTDPSTVAGAIGPQLQGLQQADQQQLQAQQMQAGMLALIDAMRNQPNPAAQAAVTEPGYPTPPPPAGGLA